MTLAIPVWVLYVMGAAAGVAVLILMAAGVLFFVFMADFLGWTRTGRWTN